MAALPRWWPPIGHWMLFTSLLSAWCSLYFGIKAMLDLEAERARSVRALKLADSARLRALQSQLNPHFLFNALNGIATLIREGDRTRAAATVDTLSDFLRLTLQKLDSPEIPVREELAFVEQYLRIQRLRFGSSFRATVDADPETHRRTCSDAHSATSGGKRCAAWSVGAARKAARYRYRYAAATRCS